MTSELAQGVDAVLDPIPAGAEPESRELEAGIGLCMSGGGYRAMLFHAGVVWRLNELGLLQKLDTISSVSGGSITAGVLACQWTNLDFGAGERANNFPDLIVEPLRTFARKTIDSSSVVTGGLIPGISASDMIRRAYDSTLFKGATLQDIPDSPKFLFCATSVQTGSLVRFSKKRLADWQVGEVPNPKIPLAAAVTASSAFPPLLSPMELRIPAGAMQAWPSQAAPEPPYSTEMILTDGGVYDNLGLEPVWKRYKCVLVSDAGQKIEADATPAEDWPRHMKRVLDVIDNQVRSLRKRQVIASYETGRRMGTYWGIRTDITRYGLEDALICDHRKTLELAATPTRLAKLPEATQERLINWGYAVCDAAMRRHAPDVCNGPSPAFPYSGGVG